MNKANKPFLQDFAKAIRTDSTKADKSFYGVVKEIVKDESGKVRGYKVSLGGEDDIIECRKFAGANIGDTVMVTLMANGTAVVTGRRDGDSDASEAARTATDYIEEDNGTMRVTNPAGESIVIGAEEGRHVKINEDGIHMFIRGNTEGANEIAHFGYGETQSESGQTNAPYYNLGVRKANTTIGAYSHAEGGNTTASGSRSHAEGFNTVASDWVSHAEGEMTTASGNRSHSEGFFTTASGVNSHAEGSNTTASGSSSHAEGYHTIASGANSHAEGNNTIARGLAQTTMGKYNAEDTTSALIIGNGTSDTDRSNAMTVDFDGNVDIAGAYKKNGLEIGEIVEASTEGNTALTANTAKVVASITLPKGKYTIQGNARFNSISSAGTRLLSISTSTTMNYQGYNEVYVPANNNGYVNVTRILEVTEDNTTVNLLAYCSSAINVSYRYLKAIRQG